MRSECARARGESAHQRQFIRTYVALYLHAWMRALLHASLTTHVILSHCILPVVPCYFPVDSPVGLP